MEDFDYGRTYFPIYAMVDYNFMLLMHNDPIMPDILPDTFLKILHRS